MKTQKTIYALQALKHAMILLLPLTAGNINAWSWRSPLESVEQDVSQAQQKINVSTSNVAKNIKQAAKKTGKSLENVAHDVASGVNAMYDATTSFYVSYTPKPGFPMGIENLSIQLLYPSNRTRTIHLITNGTGHTQLLSGVAASSSTSLTNLALGSKNRETTVSLYFTLGVTKNSFAVSTQEHITTNTYNSVYNTSSSNNSNNRQNNSTVRHKNIGSAVVPFKAAPGQAQYYKVIINKTKTTKTPISRKFYISPHNS